MGAYAWAVAAVSIGPILLMVVVALSCAFMGWAVVYLTAKVPTSPPPHFVWFRKAQNGRAVAYLQDQDGPGRRAAVDSHARFSVQ